MTPTEWLGQCHIVAASRRSATIGCFRGALPVTSDFDDLSNRFRLADHHWLHDDSFLPAAAVVRHTICPYVGARTETIRVIGPMMEVELW